jgi:hypothetical protein
MRKLSVLDLVNEVNMICKNPRVKTIDDSQNLTSALALISLKHTAEELSSEFSWIQQLKKTRFVCNHTFGWNEEMQGYDLNLLTDNLFARFTTSYLYDMTKKKIIPEIDPDDKIRSEIVQDKYYNRFLRCGDYLVFQPDMDNDTVVEFYYQTGVIAYEIVSDEKVYSDTFNSDDQFSVLNDKLVIRGAASKYRIAEGYDNSREEAIFAKILEEQKGSFSPKGIIQSNNRMIGLGNVEDVLGLPIF